jgi:ribosomal protein S18 acetylase RimI-like enzyme
MQPHDLNTTEHYVSNIQNLTDLWMAMGADTTGPDTGPGLRACDHWPDRLWFDVGCHPDRSDALRLIDVARAAARPQLLPVWSRDEPHPSGPAQTEGWSLAREFGAAGCKVTFAQTLMALNLASWRSNAVAASEIKLQEVQRETGDWADVASRSFGYTVPSAVTDHLIEHAGVRLIVARRDGQAVGTGLVYARGATAGLHMVGVVPEARRQGIARKIMLRLLDDAHARGFGLATLQASAMGQGLYQELGFVPQGRILNFQLP